MALRRIARYTKKRRSLTGTPDPNGYINLFSQFVILNPDIFGTNKGRFQERYVLYRGPYKREIMGYQREDELLALVRSCSSIIRAEDYFDVPPLEEIVRHITLPVGTREMYRELKETGVLDTEQFNIDATHQLAKLTRLSQLALGYLPVNDPEEESVAWLHDEKIKSIVADCAEPLASGQKVVISHRWKPEGERVVAALKKKFGARVVHELNGRTKGDRTPIVAPFDIDQDVVSDARIMVAQETAGGVGISFARADHLHFLSWSFDWGDVHQMSQRTWHEDKKFRTETYHVADGTVDVYARNVIRRKASATILLREIGFRAAADGAFPGEE
jgi:sugar phosphate isomerase/epimerase